MEIRHVITEFIEPITALPTDPQLAPEELKRRLQAPAEELRAAHNALAKEVGGIADATYPDTVTEAMLTPEVRETIAAKAEQSALEAETAARESADSAPLKRKPPRARARTARFPTRSHISASCFSAVIPAQASAQRRLSRWASARGRCSSRIEHHAATISIRST